MSKNNVVKLAGRETIVDPLTELMRTGAEQLIYQAVEAELLELLAKTPGQAISIEQLIREGLGYKSGDPQAQETLRVHISRLRRKLGSDYILTIRGGGYALADIPLRENS